MKGFRRWSGLFKKYRDLSDFLFTLILFGYCQMIYNTRKSSNCDHYELPVLIYPIVKFYIWINFKFHAFVNPFEHFFDWFYVCSPLCSQVNLKEKVKKFSYKIIPTTYILKSKIFRKNISVKKVDCCLS